jgi:hypothetical protein
MPRRRPAQVRAGLPIRQRPGQRVRQVSRVSAATLRAIAELERARLRPGAIAEALDGWGRFVRGPVRDLDDYAPELCPCPGCQWHDPVVRRQALRTALHALPTTAARELRALIRPLDEIYLARSIPEPDTMHIRELLTITPVRTKLRTDPHRPLTTAANRGKKR